MLPLVSRVVQRSSVGPSSQRLRATYGKANFTPNTNSWSGDNRRSFISIVSPEVKKKSSSQNTSDSDYSGDNIEHEDDWQSILHTAFTFIMLLHVVDEFYTFTTCVGPSMLPTFKEDGDVVIVERLDHSKSIIGRLLCNNKDKDGKPRRNFYKKGDAVISLCKDDLEKTVCKRIAAVEGDRVSYRGNGILSSMVRVPKGHVWLLGDNPANSKDSRQYGAVPVSYIQGRIICKVNIPYGFFLPHLKVIEWVEHECPLVGEKRKKLVLKKQIEVKKVGRVEVPVPVSSLTPDSKSDERKDDFQPSQQSQQSLLPQDANNNRQQNRQQLSQLQQHLHELKQLERRQGPHPPAQQHGQGVREEVDTDNVVAGSAVVKGKDDSSGGCVDPLTAECSPDDVSVESNNDNSDGSRRAARNETSGDSEVSDDPKDR